LAALLLGIVDLLFISGERAPLSVFTFAVFHVSAGDFAVLGAVIK